MTRPNTPIWEESYHEKRLDRAFELNDVGQSIKGRVYHEAADPWPVGHTPPEITERRRAELIAKIDLYGYSDGNSGGDQGDDAVPDVEDPLDVEATLGGCLVPRPNTPIWEELYHENFAARLNRAFERYDFRQSIRRRMYHEAADEWPMGHTPPEVLKRRRAELKARKKNVGIVVGRDRFVRIFGRG